MESPRLDYRDNPEHGLRLILTFKPATSFLVPLDRCVSLAREALVRPGASTDTGESTVVQAYFVMRS